MLALLLSPKNKHNSMFALALCSLCFYYDQIVKIHITNHKMLFPILNNFVHTIIFCTYSYTSFVLIRTEYVCTRLYSKTPNLLLNNRLKKE